MTYTTLAPSQGADNHSRALIKYLMLSPPEKAAFMALLERAANDPAYLPTVDDLKSEMGRQQAA